MFLPTSAGPHLHLAFLLLLLIEQFGLPRFLILLDEAEQVEFESRP
jgi:hypothetical protein